MRAVETLEAEAERDVDTQQENQQRSCGFADATKYEEARARVARSRKRLWRVAEGGRAPRRRGAAAERRYCEIIIVKCRKTKKRRRCGGGKALSARMEQLHRRW